MRISASDPSEFTEVAAIARFWGETILPMPPPIVLAARRICGSRPAPAAAVDWRFANSAPAEVAEPATAVPIQPRMGERKANAAPVVASAAPIEVVCPEKFMTKARAMTEAIVRIAMRSE